MDICGTLPLLASTLAVNHVCRVRIHEDSCTIQLPYAAIPAEHAHTCPTFPNISPIFTDSVHQCIWGTTDPDYLVILQHDPRAPAGLISSNASKVLPIRWAIAHGNILLMTPHSSAFIRSHRSSRWFAFCSNSAGNAGILSEIIQKIKNHTKNQKSYTIYIKIYIKIYNHTCDTQLSTNLRCHHGPLSFMACLSGNDCNLARRRGSSTAGFPAGPNQQWMQKNKTQLTKECI